MNEEQYEDNKIAMNILLHLSAAMRELNSRKRNIDMRGKLDAAREHIVKALEEIDSSGTT